MSSQAVQRVRLADCPAVAWKNGGGLTRELLTWAATPRTPLAQGSQDWDLRVSVADIERDGPFSTFAGIDRGFAVVQGAGVQLAMGNAPQGHTADVRAVSCADEAIEFSGELSVYCRLQNGPTRDLNFMVRRERGRLHMRRARSGSSWGSGFRWWAIFCWDEGRLEWPDQGLDTPQASLLWWADKAPMSCSPTWHSQGLAYWMGWEPR